MSQLAHDNKAVPQVIRSAVAHSALSKGKLVSFNASSSYGLITAAIPANGVVCWVGVALKDIASGDMGDFCVEGECQVYAEESTTAGNGLDADNSLTGAGDSAGAASVIAGDAKAICGVWLETRTGAGIARACLFPGTVTATT